ncbi:MAG TPA: response regulator [Candidatus Acidoferrum sp.]|nr:response regulator [Candidatus Acidoferrum sp.]
MTVMIADPEERTRLIVRTGLENAGFHVCGEAADGYDAVDKATALSPNVVVLDLRMPMLNGIEVASILRQRLPDSKIVLLSTYNVGESLVGVWGITAIVAKTDGLANLVDCVRRVAGADFVSSQ